VNVILDKWDLRLGSDVAHFMESSVRDSERVVIVCTPKYAEKANSGKGGAGYEKMIVTGEMYRNQFSTKFIPLLRSGSEDTGLPTYLTSKNYIDFRDGSEFEAKLEELLRDLLNVPKNPRPPIGQSPFSTTGEIKKPHSPKPATMPDLPPPLDMALTPPQTRHNAETVTYCQRCGVFPGGPQTECTGLSSSHSFMTRTGVIYCSCCGQRAGVRSVCKRAIGTSHSFVAGDGSEYCQRCGVGLGVSVPGCVGLQTCHDFVKREFTSVVRPEESTFRTNENYTVEMRRLLQGILGLIRQLDENYTPMTLTEVVQPLRDRLVEFHGILKIAPMLNPMSPFLLHDLNQLFEVVRAKETGVSRIPGFEIASKMFLNPQTPSFVSKLRTELEEGLRKYG
jgi:hypothetical protein